jgi:hypothetical protein
MFRVYLRPLLDHVHDGHAVAAPEIVVVLQPSENLAGLHRRIIESEG